MIWRLFLTTALLVRTTLTAAAERSGVEIDAFLGVNQTTDVDSRIQAANASCSRFPTNTLAPCVLEMGAEANQVKGDAKRTIFYHEQALIADPKNYNAMLMIAAETAPGTREFDIDQDQNLGRATKLVKYAIAASR